MNQDPTKALQYVLQALQASQKNAAEILQILSQAKEDHEKMEELTQQMGNMGVFPSQIVSWNGQSSPTYSCFEDLNTQNSIIAEQGKEDILRAAYEDGSSSICTLCGGLVSNARRQAHFQYWCPSLNNTGQ